MKSTKQKKVMNSIEKSNTSGVYTKTFKTGKPNDECYTSMQDIMNELSYWAKKGKFEGKNIICPCDWNILGDFKDNKNCYSITIKFNKDNVDVKGNTVVKTNVQYSLFDDNNIPTSIEVKENEIDDILRNQLVCNFVRVLTQNARRWGIKSITMSGYNPAVYKGIKFQDIDYSKYDICITNPPFSLMKEFTKKIIEESNSNGHHLDFIFLAPFLNRAHPCEAIYLMTHHAWLGSGIHLNQTFDNPTPENNYSGTKAVACDWIVSWPDAQDERDAEDYKTGIKYETYKDDFMEMPNMIMKDGTHAIKVSSKYPDDYDGWMFGNIGILDRLNQHKYEWYSVETSKYYNTGGKANPFDMSRGKYNINENLEFGNGKHFFGGIVFRKKPEFHKKAIDNKN